MVPLVISDPKLSGSPRTSCAATKIFGAFTQRPLGDDGDADDDLDGVFRVGTAVVVHKSLRFPDGSMRLLGKGVCRVEISHGHRPRPVRAGAGPAPRRSTGHRAPLARACAQRAHRLRADRRASENLPERAQGSRRSAAMTPGASPTSCAPTSTCVLQRQAAPARNLRRARPAAAAAQAAGPRAASRSNSARSCKAKSARKWTASSASTTCASR